MGAERRDARKAGAVREYDRAQSIVDRIEYDDLYKAGVEVWKQRLVDTHLPTLLTHLVAKAEGNAPGNAPTPTAAPTGT